MLKDVHLVKMENVHCAIQDIMLIANPNVKSVLKIVGSVHLKINVLNAFQIINLLVTYVSKIYKIVWITPIMELA